MKLTIRRSQEDVKGLLGGHKGVAFTIYGKCHISDTERQLLDRYKMWGYTVASREVTVGSGSTTIETTVKVLIDGTKYTARSIGELLHFEESLKQSCRELQVLLKVMASFGGEETIEIESV